MIIGLKFVIFDSNNFDSRFKLIGKKKRIEEWKVPNFTS